MKVVEHRLGKVREGRVAIIVAGVEAVGEARVRQQPPCLGRIEYGGWRFPVEFEVVRDDAFGNFGIAEKQRLINGVAVDGKVCRPPHPFVVPW